MWSVTNLQIDLARRQLHMFGRAPTGLFRETLSAMPEPDVGPSRMPEKTDKTRRGQTDFSANASQGHLLEQKPHRTGIRQRRLIRTFSGKEAL